MHYNEKFNNLGTHKPLRKGNGRYDLCSLLLDQIFPLCIELSQVGRIHVSSDSMESEIKVKLALHVSAFLNSYVQ
jgi:hypothetical protein